MKGEGRGGGGRGERENARQDPSTAAFLQGLGQSGVPRRDPR